jgi:hypothetical protein
MRCPKCKFISFDDLATCAKCSHDISALALELRGTCIEKALPEFFLGAVVQASNLEDEDFSASQTLPPIDHGEIDFDDTTGGFASLASRGAQEQEGDFDDSIGVVMEDDVAIELGEIMPIDLDQLDSTSVMPDDISDTLSLESDAAGHDRDSATDQVDLDTDIDLDLTGKFASTNLDLGAGDKFPDIDLDDTDLAASSVDDAPFEAGRNNDDTVLALDSELQDAPAESFDSEFDFSDDLIAELGDASLDDLDATTTLQSPSPLQDKTNLSATEQFSLTDESLSVDESLVAAFSDDEPETGEADDSLSSFDFNPSDTGELELDSSSLVSSEASGDFTGEFPPISDGEEPELNSLDFSDIDVSDLFSSDTTEEQGVEIFSGLRPDDTLQENDESASAGFLEDQVESAIQPASDFDFHSDEVDIDSFDDGDLTTTIDVESLAAEVNNASNADTGADIDLPEVDLLLDDDDDIPPDLPA